MDDRTQAIRDAVIVLQARFDLLDRQVQQNGITAQDIRERQAAIRNDIEHLKAMADQQPTGFLERIFSNALTAKDKGVLVIAGLIIITLALIFFGPSAEAIIGIITALQGN